jgi:hypothetical protein
MKWYLSSILILRHIQENNTPRLLTDGLANPSGFSNLSWSGFANPDRAGGRFIFLERPYVIFKKKRWAFGVRKFAFGFHK